MLRQHSASVSFLPRTHTPSGQHRSTLWMHVYATPQRITPFCQFVPHSYSFIFSIVWGLFVRTHTHTHMNSLIRILHIFFRHCLYSHRFCLRSHRISVGSEAAHLMFKLCGCGLKTGDCSFSVFVTIHVLRWCVCVCVSLVTIRTGIEFRLSSPLPNPVQQTQFIQLKDFVIRFIQRLLHGKDFELL